MTSMASATFSLHSQRTVKLFSSAPGGSWPALDVYASQVERIEAPITSKRIARFAASSQVALGAGLFHCPPPTLF